MRFLLCLSALVFLCVSCITTEDALQLPSGELFRYPLVFNAQQNVCILVSGTEKCLIASLNRNQNAYSLSLMEPGLLTEVAVFTSDAQGKTNLLKGQSFFAGSPIDPEGLMATIRAIYDSKPPINAQDIKEVRLRDGRSFSVKVTLNGWIATPCIMPQTTSLAFSRGPSNLEISLRIVNDEVACD